MILTNKKTRISVLILYVLLFIMMRGSYVESEAYAIIAVEVLWFALAIIESPNVFINTLRNKQVFFLTLFLLYWFFLVMFNDGAVSALTSVLSKTTVYIGVYMYWYYCKVLQDEEKRKATNVVLVIWSFYCIKASVFYLQHEYAARTIAQNKMFYGNVAIGNPYALAYGSALIFIMLFNILIKRKYEKKRLPFILTVTVITLLCIILTQSTITMLAVILGVIISLIYRKQEMTTRRKSNIATIFVCICFLILILNLEWVGKSLSALGSGMNSVYGRRIAAIGMSLLGDTSQKLVMGRNELYIQSIEAYLKHPIIGNIVFNYSSSGSIGGHSELLDTLATFGGIVGSMLLYIMMKPLSIIRRNSRVLRSIGLSAAFLVMFTLNPFHSQESNFVLFFILPLVSSLFVTNEDGMEMRTTK